MEEMILHRGGRIITKQELDLIPVPDETDSYIPVSHYHLADKFLTVSRDLLTDFTLIGESYAIARQGQQLFALLNFKRDHSEIGLSVAFRNSYDRSMSVGLAIGASVFICDNLALHGEIAIMKKHTKGVWNSLEDLAITTLYRAQHNFEKVITDAERLKGISLDNREAFELMGVLYGHEVVSPRQLPVIKEEWLHPSHGEFSERNRWSFFNAVTEALKSTPPVSIMEKHVRAYREIVEDER
jgi:hypothetical protein